MLTLYTSLDGLDNYDIIHDVESAFRKIKFKGTDIEKKIIKLIDRADYLDETSIIDRFGYKLYNSELSTGCKAALVVLHNPDKIINIIECGLNARDVICSLCEDGFVLLNNDEVDMIPYSNYVNIKLDKYIFHSIDRLNTYILDERPYDIVCDGKDVEYVSQ